MDVSAAGAAVTYKAAQVQGEISTKVAEKTLDLIKNQAELVLSLIMKSMGVGTQINTLA